MSKPSQTTDFKIANRYPRIKSGHILCARCRIIMDSPKWIILNGLSDSVKFAFQYPVNSPYLIFGTKAGDSICYCGKYCATKHNHNLAHIRKWRPYYITAFFNRIKRKLRL